MTDKEEIDYKEKFDELFKRYEDLLDVLYREDDFLVEGTTENTEDSCAFKNNTCVYNKRVDMAYSATQIVEIINTMSDQVKSLEKALDAKNDIMKKIAEKLKESDIDNKELMEIIFFD